MIKILSVCIIIYAISQAVLVMIITINDRWDDDNKKERTIFLFTPLLNTLVLCVGIFCVIPSDLIKQHKENIKWQHRNDSRWNLMNNRNEDN